MKPASKTVWHQGERSLIDYFGEDCLVEQITVAGTDAYKQHLIGQGLALYTVRKRLQSQDVLQCDAKAWGVGGEPV